MPWSLVETVYAWMVVCGFGLFILTLGAVALLCNGPGARRREAPLEPETESRKAHSDKLAHTLDSTA